MLNYLLEKIKQFNFSLRFSIVSIFVTLFSTTILLLIVFNYFRVSSLLSSFGFQLMRQTSSTIREKIIDQFQSLMTINKFSSQLIQQKVVDPNESWQPIEYILSLMEIESPNVPMLQRAIWSDEKGSFFSAKKLEDLSIVSETINRSKIPITGFVIYREPNGNLLKQTKPKLLNYDPRQSIWYRAAKAAGRPIWTKIYSFGIAKLLVTTVATPVYNKETGELRGVFALNIRIDFLRAFIENMRISDHGVVFILHENGQLIAFPKLVEYNLKQLDDIHSLSVPWIIQSFEHYQKTHEKEFILHSNGKNYFVIYDPLSFATHQWLIGIVVPEDDFISPFKKINFIMLSVGFIIFLVGFGLILKFSKLLVKPIKKVIIETDKIKHFELEQDIVVKSRIKEISELFYAVSSMKKGLRSFKKYVPSTLVRQLIETGKDVYIGGEKKILALFFSDIKDFTMISELRDPDKLIKDLNQYLQETSKIILDYQGTIDKYIGDAIMAFWGAPLSVEQPCHLAASAALKIQQCLSEIDKKWISQGKLPFYTRIGIHFGEVIVGNYGSQDRLNYTAIGDVVNIASRLEGANKIYDTKIMISQDVYDIIKNDFAIRQLDVIAVKGKTQGIAIYELMANNANELSFDLKAYQASFAIAFTFYQKQHWDDAIPAFEQCLKIYPGDTVAPVFIKRCQSLKLSPPERGWGGLWRLAEK